MKTKTTVAIALILLVWNRYAMAHAPEEGKAIFMTRCAGCHTVNKVLTGPALAGVDERYSVEWITRFVQSSQSLIKSGDKDAVAVYEKFNRTLMPDHTDLTAEHISQLLEYIKNESKNVSAAPFAKPQDRKSGALPLSANDTGVFALFIAFVALLIAALLFAVRVRSLQHHTGEDNMPA